MTSGAWVITARYSGRAFIVARAVVLTRRKVRREQMSRKRRISLIISRGRCADRSPRPGGKGWVEEEVGGAAVVRSWSRGQFCRSFAGERTASLSFVRRKLRRWRISELSDGA